MVPLLAEGNALVDLILQPVPVKSGDFNGYRFVFGGHTWIYILGDGRSFCSLSFFCRKTAGSLFAVVMHKLGVSLRDSPQDLETCL
jgi:hypothetical protein